MDEPPQASLSYDIDSNRADAIDHETPIPGRGLAGDRIDTYSQGYDNLPIVSVCAMSLDLEGVMHIIRIVDSIGEENYTRFS